MSPDPPAYATTLSPPVVQSRHLSLSPLAINACQPLSKYRPETKRRWKFATGREIGSHHCLRRSHSLTSALSGQSCPALLARLTIRFARYRSRPIVSPPCVGQLNVHEPIPPRVIGMPAWTGLVAIAGRIAADRSQN